MGDTYLDMTCKLLCKNKHEPFFKLYVMGFFMPIEIGEWRLESSEKSIGWRGGAGTAKFPTTKDEAIGADK